MEICGDQGETVIDKIMSEARLLPRDDAETRVWRPSIFRPELLAFDGSFEHRVHAFVDDLFAGRESAPTGLDGLKALRIAEATIKSREEQRTVVIDAG